MKAAQAMRGKSTRGMERRMQDVIETGDSTCRYKGEVKPIFIVHKKAVLRGSTPSSINQSITISDGDGINP